MGRVKRSPRCAMLESTYAGADNPQSPRHDSAPMNFTWSDDKNYLLKRHRGIAFEDVAIKVLQRDIVGIEYDHNPERYPGQHLFLVMEREYLYVVPFYQIDADTVRFVTIYPDGGRMRDYGLRRRSHDSH